MSNLEVDDNNNNSDLPTEEKINEWTNRSLKEGICGIVNCFNKQTKQCKKCTNYYCQYHFPSHLDLLPDNELELEYSSSNEGLERYIDESVSAFKFPGFHL